MVIRILIVSIFVTVLIFLPLQMVFAESQIPFWVRENVKWWTLDKIPSAELEESLSWLAEKNHFNLKITEQKIPSWFKTVAIWWTDDSISDQEFLNFVSYLAQKGIVKISLQNTHDEKSYVEHEYSGPSPLFRTFAYKKDFVFDNGQPIPREFQFEFKADVAEDLSLIKSDGDTVVIIPIFTSTAYWEPGFYTYYRNECDTKCLTKKIEYGKPYGYSASSNAIKVFYILGYDLITDIDVDKNPNILSNYKKVIVLHNEYVTKIEFDAITSHPKVVYLYPNALYAVITKNGDMITLIRGHNYPSPEIKNGFDWEFENTNFEYDNKCETWEFYEINNGAMLDCFPENILFRDFELLKAIRDY